MYPPFTFIFILGIYLCHHHWLWSLAVVFRGIHGIACEKQYRIETNTKTGRVVTYYLSIMLMFYSSSTIYTLKRKIKVHSNCRIYKKTLTKLKKIINICLIFNCVYKCVIISDIMYFSYSSQNCCIIYLYLLLYLIPPFQN